MNKLIPLLDALQTSQDAIIKLLETVSGTPDWSPAEDRWSFRFIAAHLATTEKECFLKRVEQFQTEAHPHFQYYENSGRDFSAHQISEDIPSWKRTREELIRKVRSMDENQMEKVATHERMGDMNVEGLLQLILDHDMEHLDELEENLNLLHKG